MWQMSGKLASQLVIVELKGRFKCTIEIVNRQTDGSAKRYKNKCVFRNPEKNTTNLPELICFNPKH